MSPFKGLVVRNESGATEVICNIVVLALGYRGGIREQRSVIYWFKQINTEITDFKQSLFRGY